MDLFKTRVDALTKEHEALINRKNSVKPGGNGIFDRYANPVLTAAHTPLFWRYDFSETENPYFMERMGIGCVFNPGAIYFDGKYCLVARVEGADRKSFFAVAESGNGIEGFRFRDYPILMPETDEPDTNIYDMRLTRHEDGYIYGLFCTERKDPDAPEGDTSAAVAKCGIARTKDLERWERLADLDAGAAQQRNVVLHPEFINGKYAFYTRPQDGFIEVGKAGGIGWGLSDSMENAKITEEFTFEPKVYHTIKEVKNGQGPTPVKTDEGWLHIAHGVRNTAAGLRYVLYAFLTDLNEPYKLLYTPGGYLLAPEGEERVGDVSNVVFCNGMIEHDGMLYIYYASSDTRVHVATTTIEQMLDYVKHTPADGLTSHHCVQRRKKLIDKYFESRSNGK